MPAPSFLKGGTQKPAIIMTVLKSLKETNPLDGIAYRFAKKGDTHRVYQATWFTGAYQPKTDFA